MAAQDDARENQLVDLFNLDRPENRVRHGIDAILDIDGQQLEFELKSVTTSRGGMSTVRDLGRDLGRDHIEKWRGKHWIVAFYTSKGLMHCKYASPDDMSAWIEKIWGYIKPDFDIADCVPPLITLDALESVVGRKEVYTRDDAKTLHKLQYTAAQYAELMDLPDGYSPERMLEIFKDRTKYLIQRGSTLNNPHIPAHYFDSCASITRDHASTLRGLVRTWLKSKTAKTPSKSVKG